MLIVLLLAPIRSTSAAKSVLQASATTDTDLKSRIVKVQTTLVAGPRNHFYRTAHTVVQAGLFCFVSDAKFDHFRDLADDLDFEPMFGGTYGNVLDQASQDLQGLIPNIRLIERMLKPLNLAPIDQRQIRMEADRACWLSG